MARLNRIVQNKSKRETNEAKNAELQEIRKENQKLKREIARLRREVHKTEGYTAPEKETSETQPARKVEKEPTCPECGSTQLTQMQFAVKVFLICKKCKYRKAVE